ncbi:hypothetical protein CCAX7_61720 [Capsulimonas corticalis]|uniref:Uncharacterized protein n=1 Tax=Capsulimonas corticalis TaxID=2219043 RepID=A0A402CWD8_9BACT|nr:hypothetical protein [Capsulimonas corticalis]BDI34121.1 hypothetical protein CCAX7_61720 [Capsulimonas corticalis]
MTPDERALTADLARPPFQSQIDRRWGGAKIAWPYLYLWIRARHTPSEIEHYWMRIDCSGYPQKAPTGTFWDMEHDVQLDNARRPWGVGEVAHIFRTDWPGPDRGSQGSALYSPVDRVAIETHGDWPTTHAATLWKPTREIVYYLDEVARHLDSPEYTGPRGTQP